MKRFIVLVIDSFGIGEMDDVKILRKQDIGANTFRHVLSKRDKKLKNLEKLGLCNSAGFELENFKFSVGANFGKSKLKHFGCDTFYGHQELMGTDPKEPVEEPFCNNIDLVESELIKRGYSVERFGTKNKILVVNDCATVGDNLEADLGQVYNITGTFQKISYEELLKIGRIVRECVKVPRVITFGGDLATINSIKSAYEWKLPFFAGVNAPKSLVYKSGYQVQHMGYGVDETVQLPTIIGEKIPVILIGKVADIVKNPWGTSLPFVDTKKVMESIKDNIIKNDVAFICGNIQETDLAGHEENSDKYFEKLEIVDQYLDEIIPLLDNDDILIITADHGNDPTIGHSKHTREYVPILIYSKNLENINIGTRDSLADIGQTAAEYFGYTLPNNGLSFLDKIIKRK